MPLPSTIVFVILHLCMSLGLNWVAKELGLINNSEVIALYFVVLAGKYYDAQTKFSIAYSQDPDLVENLMREQLKKDE